MIPPAGAGTHRTSAPTGLPPSAEPAIWRNSSVGLGAPESVICDPRPLLVTRHRADVRRLGGCARLPVLVLRCSAWWSACDGAGRGGFGHRVQLGPAEAGRHVGPPSVNGLYALMGGWRDGTVMSGRTSRTSKSRYDLMRSKMMSVGVSASMS